MEMNAVSRSPTISDGVGRPSVARRTSSSARYPTTEERGNQQQRVNHHTRNEPGCFYINAEHAVIDGGGARRIELASSTDSSRGHVSLTVRDTGPGIPTEVLPRIFDPFFTTKEVGRGTGLGLAITYGIVQEHGGTISASNAPGGGAMFRLDLPSAELVVK